MSLALFHDTIVAASTPPGKSALAVVRLSGSEAIRISASLCDDPESVLTLRTHCAAYTNLISEGEQIDDVVLQVFRAPHGFTGEDLVEISTHGSQVIVERLIEATRKLGARPAEPGEFSRRAFWNGKISLEEVELIPLKIEALSGEQLRGTERGLKEKFDVLRSAYDTLIALVAQIDAEIDFGESDEIEVPGLNGAVDSVSSQLTALLERSSTRRLNSGYFTVALVGPPNVGKSSLFNALLRMERSIVSDVPGTTRDYLEAFIEIGGMPVKLVDTAGLRTATESIEERGIALGKTAALEADLVLRLTDPGSRDSLPLAGELLVHNKADVDGWSDGVCICAISGAGLEGLHFHMSEALSGFRAELSRPRLLAGEAGTLAAVVENLRAVDLAGEPPLIADQLRDAIERIGQLIGCTTSVESLNYIFSSMCIGK